MKVRIKNVSDGRILLVTVPQPEAIEKGCYSKNFYDSTTVEKSEEIQKLLQTKQIQLERTPAASVQPPTETVSTLDAEQPPTETVSTLDTGLPDTSSLSNEGSEVPLDNDTEFFNSLDERMLSQALGLIQKIEESLQQLKTVFESAKAFEPPKPLSDSIPKSPQPTPKTVPTPDYPNLKTYLSLPYLKKLEFLRSTRDVGLLRLIIRFDTRHPNCAKIARGKVQQLDRENELLQTTANRDRRSDE